MYQNEPPQQTIPTGIVTSIEASRRRPGRFEVRIDEASVLLSVESIDGLRLGVGAIIGEELGNRVANEAAALRTYDRATAMLAARGRSRADLRRVLVRKGELAEHVDAAITRLGAEGFLDDTQFARQFARSRGHAGLPRGRVQRELTRRGVARAVADLAVASVFTEELIDEAASLERAAEKKLRTLGRADHLTRRRRLYAFLARRGYEPGAVRDLVRRLTPARRDDG